MANVTRQDAYIKRYSGYQSNYWETWEAAEELYVYGWAEHGKALAIRLASDSSRSGVITKIVRPIGVVNYNSDPVTVSVALFVNDDPTTYGRPTNAASRAYQVQTVTCEGGSTESGSFVNVNLDFSDLAIPAKAELYFLVYPSVNTYENIIQIFGDGGVNTETTEPCVVTATSPKNVTRTATNSMSYSWQYVGDTAQASADVQYWDGYSWYSLGTAQGPSTTLYSSVRPPASSAAKWRVRATDQRGNVSAWSEATYTLQYISTSYLAPYNSKTSGSINRFAAQTFEVQMYANGTPYTDYPVVDPVFYWRQSGETEWNSIQMTREYVGSVYKRATVTIPANTFPKGTIQWYASAGDGAGNTRTTSAYNLSTVAVPISATPTAPIDTVETANTPTVFTWRNSGTITIYPAGAQLQYSEDNISWTDFGSVTGSAATYTAEAGALPSGQLFWRVRVKNVDDVWGSWSDPVTFTNFGAPSVSNVIADGKPFTTITWTSSTQQAYRITIDGSVVYGTYWGANVYVFTLPLPLADGAHTAAVEVQNEYGQWSQPAQTDFTVTNVPGQPVILSGSFDRDAALRWTCEDATADFLIYRDDVQIGHSSGYSFTDRTVLGFHTWKVINRLPGGYYTASNTVSGTLCTEGLALALLAGGPWIDLTLSENPIRTTTAAAGRSVILRQFAGREYPDAEAAPYKTLQISFDVSWTPAQAAQARVFEAMIGEAVIFKEPGEEAFVGVLIAFQRSHSCPARSYTATVQRIHWREYVDADS